LAHAPLPPCVDVALDIGIGTGVLSAILLKRGVKHIIGTDIQANCIACAHDNLSRLGFDQRFTLLQTDLYPPMQQADLIVCNPPWLPGKARSSLELAVFDQASAMLTGFLSQLKFHLNPNGQAWLIISDLAQRLGLQPEDHLQKLFEQHHIQVLEQHCIQAQHPKFHLARSAEITSLWRLSLP
jgi:methylase of polypeptide subunit release factors